MAVWLTDCKEHLSLDNIAHLERRIFSVFESKWQYGALFCSWRSVNIVCVLLQQAEASFLVPYVVYDQASRSLMWQVYKFDRASHAKRGIYS